MRSASLLLVTAPLWATGCGADDCETLCARLASSLDGCLEDWSATWQDLGADGQRDWRQSCQEDWSVTRADLEPREVQLAVEACSDTLSQLADTTCDELRALYLDAR
ncbi:MAG: hypothetical protein JXB39_10645 [Deltaproteobacteria bacterium]|nr:hypothetical protein [Deltaproteobacteria bacterium]